MRCSISLANDTLIEESSDMSPELLAIKDDELLSSSSAVVALIFFKDLKKAEAMEGEDVGLGLEDVGDSSVV